MHENTIQGFIFGLEAGYHHHTLTLTIATKMQTINHKYIFSKFSQNNLLNLRVLKLQQLLMLINL